MNSPPIMTQTLQGPSLPGRVDGRVKLLCLAFALVTCVTTLSAVLAARPDVVQAWRGSVDELPTLKVKA